MTTTPTGIRTKLIAFAVLAVAFAIAIAVLAGLYFRKMERSTVFKDHMAAIAKDALDARVAEKAYLQFHEGSLATNLHALCARLESRIGQVPVEDTDDSTKANLAEAQETVGRYRRAFDELVDVAARTRKL